MNISNLDNVSSWIEPGYFFRSKAAYISSEALL